MPVRAPELAASLIDSLSSGLLAIDVEGSLTALNEAAQRILGGPAGDAADWLGRDFRDALGFRPELLGLLEDALAGRERPSRAELLLPARSDAPETTVGFTMLAIRDARAELRGVAIQFRDLSAYERDDERERLRDRLAALGEMAAGLAHELRNPLAGMEVMAGLLKRRLPEGGEEHALVLDLLAQLRVLARSLDETLEFVRPVEPAAHGVDPAQLLDLAADRACARVAFPGKIERRYAPQAPPALGDPEQLLVVLTDLVLNALEAMADGPEAEAPRLVLGIDVESRPVPHAPRQRTWPPTGPEPRGQREVVLSVADSGPGVPAELRDRIFYPFFTTKDAGSGVGLAKAQKIVISHGGSIELDAGPGGGATFRVRLPASGEAA